MAQTQWPLRKKKRHKYGARKTKCLSQHAHDSKAEAIHCNKLLARKQKGEILDYKTQVSYDLIVNGRKICRHKVDFVLEMPDKSLEVDEVKGKATADWSIKRKLFEALFPDIPYNVIKKSRR